MTRQELVSIVLKAFDTVGVYIDTTDDFNMTDYFSSSVQFIQFVIELEDLLGISYPDDMLMYSTIQSFETFINQLLQVVEEQKKGGKRQ